MLQSAPQKWTLLKSLIVQTLNGGPRLMFVISLNVNKKNYFADCFA